MDTGAGCHGMDAWNTETVCMTRKELTEIADRLINALGYVMDARLRIDNLSPDEMVYRLDNALRDLHNAVARLLQLINRDQ